MLPSTSSRAPLITWGARLHHVQRLDIFPGTRMLRVKIPCTSDGQSSPTYRHHWPDSGLRGRGRSHSPPLLSVAGECVLEHPRHQGMEQQREGATQTSLDPASPSPPGAPDLALSGGTRHRDSSTARGQACPPPYTGNITLCRFRLLFLTLQQSSSPGLAPHPSSLLAVSSLPRPDDRGQSACRSRADTMSARTSLFETAWRVFSHDTSTRSANSWPGGRR